MKAGQTTLKPLIEGQKQYRVPIFQRAYVWDGPEVLQLWEDMTVQYRAMRPAAPGEAAPPTRSTHFLGSFVLAPLASPARGVTPYVIVDGQQRLTTLFLALAALRDVQAKTDPGAWNRSNQLYLRNEFAEGLDRYKLLPAQLDREAFFACIDGTAPENGAGRIFDAYHFFRGRLTRNFPDDDEPLDLVDMERVIIERLAVVEITVEADDNPHRIFESLNATGVGLTQADLLRNYLFMLLPTRAQEVYEGVWLPMERELGSENLEGLARVDLQRRGIDATKDDVYRLHRQRLEGVVGGEDDVVAEIRDLAVRAQHYRRLIDPAQEEHPAVRASLQRLQRWGAQTTYPLLMHVYDLVDRKLATKDDLARVLEYIESFLVRRQIAQVPTNQLNRLFVDMIGQLPADKPVAEAIRDALSGERRYWPTDEQIRDAVRTKWFYYSGRWDQRKLIFERIEQSYRHLEPVDFSAAKLTIEHVMPQTLSDEWRDALRDQGADPEQARDEFLHTLGNLTLTGYNAQLSNDVFARKQQIYQSSNLQMNRSIAEASTWGPAEILARAAELSERIVAIWPAPVPGARGVPGGAFDWSRIDAAVSAIPPGRWTTYGDLAQLGGTSPQAVGNRMGSSATSPNAYRVLDRHGRISPAFHWSDPEDGREVRALLGEEGGQFDSDGVADWDQHLSAYDLALLLPYECDADELERLRLLDEGKSQCADGAKPWVVDGMSWHLGQQASAKTRPMAEMLVGLIATAAPDTAPVWTQKTYVKWEVEGTSWLTLWCRSSWLWLGIRDAPFSSEDVARRLGFPLVDTPSWTNSGPSQVQRRQTRGWTLIMLRNRDDLAGVPAGALTQILTEAHDACLTARGREEAADKPWLVDGRQWHLGERCSLKTRPILESLLGIMGAVAPPDSGPHWNKYYIGYEVGDRLWASLKPWDSWVWLRLHGTMLSSHAVSDRLGFEYVPSGEEPAWTSEGPSLVQPSMRLRGIRIMLRSLNDVQGGSAAAIEDVLRMSLGSAAAGQVSPLAGEDDDEEVGVAVLEADSGLAPADTATGAEPAAT
jgi:alkylated DNA nucleotide flippase Atl1